tara:strand:- start:214 stop:420 length:207 start_codon:yes stop_codon:yes gene_type:complete
MELNNDIVIISIGCGFVFGICSMCLNFVIKSRCKSIKGCGIQIERDVVNQANLSDNIINIPNNLVNNN